MTQHDSEQYPKRVADRYRIETIIGEGAHATTWRGWDERLERPVAVKMLHSALANDPVFVQRFQTEARIAASVRQSNVVDIYDFGQEDGTLYIVMQFIDGENLKSLIQHSAPLPIRDCRRIIGNVLDGLQAIHAAGIIHRDIKPQNVLIGTDGIARVTDFGVAEVDVADGLTGIGMTIGTADYMAPEQAQGLPLTASADLYAAAVVLYEMLTGTLPFHGDTSRDTMLQHINNPLVPPSSRLPEHGLTHTIDAALMQSLAKEPARRFASARAMKQALGQALTTPSRPKATQTTSVITSQSSRTPRQQPAHQHPQPPLDGEGAGLTRAFRGIVWLLVIGAIGVAVWGAMQLMDTDGFDISLPNFISRPNSVDTTLTPVTGGDNVRPPQPEQPNPPVEEQQPPIQPEVIPTAPEVAPPIEPIGPDDEPIEPSGYDDQNRLV